jgi:hypothetical protein
MNSRILLVGPKLHYPRKLLDDNSTSRGASGVVMLENASLARPARKCVKQGGADLSDAERR